MLLYNDDAPKLAQLWDTQSQQLTGVELPADTSQVLGWENDTNILYKTPAGHIRRWNRLTGETSDYTDVRFNTQYRAGGMQHFPNFRDNLYLSSWMGGLDSSSNFHLFNVANEQHISFPVDTTRRMGITLREHYVLFNYDTEASRFHIYYPDLDTMIKADAKVAADAIRQTHPRFSEDGRYIFYNPSETLANGLVQSVMSDETFVIEESVKGWEFIDGQPYLLYEKPLDNGTHVFYLLNPDTRDSCKVGTFYISYINIQ